MPNDYKASKNGAYYFDGDFGWCQNWELHNHPVIWITDKQVDQKDLQNDCVTVKEYASSGRKRTGKR